MASSGKKGKKTKGKTIALTDFLADSAPPGRPLPRKSGNWADDVENDEDFHDSRKDKVVLPTGPRSTWGPEVDENKIPKNPPYLAYMSNLPYEVEEDEIAAFFKDMEIVNVRLPRDDRGGMSKMKGFGYVEFKTRECLIAALSLPDTNIRGRRTRIDVADNSDSDRRRGGRDMMGREGPDRTLTDWRAGGPEPASSDWRGPRESSDRSSSDWRGGREGGADRSSSDWRADTRGDQQDSDRDRDRDRGGFNRDREGGGFRERERDGEYQSADSRRWRDSGRDRPEGPDRTTSNWRAAAREDPPPATDGGDRERDGGFDRGGRSGGRRDFGSSGFRDNFGDRDRGGFRDSRDSGFGDRDRDRGRFGGDRGESYGGGFGDRDRRGGDRDYGGGGRDFGGPRRNYSDAGRDAGGGGGFRGREDGPPETAEPKSRPRLNLIPRTKTAEDIKVQEPSAPTSSPAPAPVSSGAGASIFGGARPVDTAAREREIEERLAREKGEVPRLLPRDDRAEDARSKSGSEQGDRDDDSVHSQAPPIRRVEPAPPPSENFWMQRTQQNRSEATEGNGHVSPQGGDRLEHREPQRRFQERPESPRRGGSDGDYDERQQISRAPRGAYDRDDRGRDERGPARDDRGGRDDRRGRDDKGGRDDRGGRGAPGNRGGAPTRGSDRQRGRGDGRSLPERDNRRDVPDDPSRMPKYHEHETPNFVASNKFANLHSDDEQNNGSD